MADDHRIATLDGLRGLAALTVVLTHFALPNPATSVDWFVWNALHPGWAGVDLFFVLSGFLITGILYDTRQTTRRWRTFYLRRVVRIFPLYFASLAFLFAVTPRLANWMGTGEFMRSEPWYAWLYLLNFQIANRDTWPDTGFGVAWTLAIEEQFYLVWPFVVFAFERRWLMRICGGMIILAVVWRIALLLSGASPNAVGVLTPGRLDSLGVGAWIALSARAPGGLRNLARWGKRAFILSAGGLVPFAVIDGTLRSETPAMQSIGYTLLALLFGAILIAAVTAPAASLKARVLGHPVLRVLGTYSYAIYLLHRPWQEVLDHTLFSGGPVLLFGSQLGWQLLYSAAGIGGSLALALISWNVLERHFLALKRFLPYERQRTVGQPLQLSLQSSATA